MKNLSYFIILISVGFFSQIAYSQDDIELLFNCPESCIDLQINGGYPSYQVEWYELTSNGDYIIIDGWPKLELEGNSGDEDLCNVQNGTYKVIVYDTYCGQINAEKSIQFSELAMSSLLVITPSGCSTSEGKLDYWKSGASGGVPPYSYDWSNGGEGWVIDNLSAGTYILTITDAVGCTLTVEHEVPGIGQPTLFGTVKKTCENVSNGEIAMLFAPEVGPLAFSWESSLDNNIQIYEGSLVEISNLSSGTYCVTATDTGNGCFAKGCMTVGVIESEEIIIQGANIKPSCDSEANGSIFPFAFGGYGNKYYEWSNGQMNYGQKTYYLAPTK